MTIARIRQRLDAACVALVTIAAFVLTPALLFAQTGVMSGHVRDLQGAALPGVTVEVTSPVLAERARSILTDNNGRYELTALPAGTYKITFRLPGFERVTRDNVRISSELTADVNAAMKVDDSSFTIAIIEPAPMIDVLNASQRQGFYAWEPGLGELPTARNLNSLLGLVPSLTNGGLAGGICSGGVGVFCSPRLTGFNAHTSADDADGLGQGRILLDGFPINAGNPNLTTGTLGGYTPDVAYSQGVIFTLSGALGDSETGGATISIVPQSGGNRFSGAFFTSYTRRGWFDRNNGSRRGAAVNLEINDHDISGTLGGRVVKDRLWFFAVARHQGKESDVNSKPVFYNLNAGVWGANYLPDRPRGELTYTNFWRNANARITVQASHKNKFDIFWDEQHTCQDPCKGTVAPYWSPEAVWSLQVRPNHLAQVSWTNPVTIRLLLEGGLSVTSQHYDRSRNRYSSNPNTIPALRECGNAGADAVRSDRVNDVAGVCTLGGWGGVFEPAMMSGSISGGELHNQDYYRSRASVSYITGSHYARLGYTGAYFSDVARETPNAPQLTYLYRSPGATEGTAVCGPTFNCGNMTQFFPDDPYNTARRPVPESFQMNTGPLAIDEKVMTSAVYLEDQWTLGRFTLNGALRYDHAASRYNPTCVGSNQFVGTRYCTPKQDGVSFDDLTPRWGIAWDVFGSGSTSIKWNMGKYLEAARVGGIYTASNPARRASNTYTRAWTDGDGDRIIDCNPLNFATNADPVSGDVCGPAVDGTGSDPSRFGRDPYGLDETGLPIGLTTTQCGRSDPGIPAAVVAYCDAANQNLLDGWGKRRQEWQFGIGIQHQVIRSFSVEITYNRRWYRRQQLTDALGLGCDLFNGSGGAVDSCIDNTFAFVNPSYDFYSIVAPDCLSVPAATTAARNACLLPDGGGYTVSGIANQHTVGGVGSAPSAVTMTNRPVEVWRGVDTIVVWRGRWGLHASGGTSTGSQYSDHCRIMVDTPDITLRNTGSRDPGCRIARPFQTNVRGSATYTIPRIDVLVSTVFQYRPGVEMHATYNYGNSGVIWADASAARATAACPNPSNGLGCFYGGSSQTTASTNLINAGDRYGEGARLFDLKVAKNIRVARTRLNLGVDVYNIFNSDAPLGYDGNWNSNVTLQANPSFWTVDSLTSPRFARLQIQFDF